MMNYYDDVKNAVAKMMHNESDAVCIQMYKAYFMAVMGAKNTEAAMKADELLGVAEDECIERNLLTRDQCVLNAEEGVCAC